MGSRGVRSHRRRFEVRLPRRTFEVCDANRQSHIRHGGHRHTGDLHLDELTPIERTFGFVDIQAMETVRIDRAEEYAMDDRASLGHHIRIPEARFTAFEPGKNGFNPQKSLSRQGCDPLRVHEGAIHK
jgi:hypothetical protein